MICWPFWHPTQRENITARYSGTQFSRLSSSGTIVSRSAYLHKESISKATAAASAQVSKFCFHRAILGIKLLHHVLQQQYLIPTICSKNVVCQCSKQQGNEKQCQCEWSVNWLWGYMRHCHCIISYLLYNIITTALSGVRNATAETPFFSCGSTAMRMEPSGRNLAKWPRA